MVVVGGYFFNLFEKQMHADCDFEPAHSHPIRKYTRKTREVALCRPFQRKTVSIMVLKSNIPQGMTLVGFTTPVESDSESVTSTISTKNQFKPSQIDQLRPINNNDGYHLVSSSSNTQPKITSVTTAPPHPPRYPSPVIHNTPPGHYIIEAGTT